MRILRWLGIRSSGPSRSKREIAYKFKLPDPSVATIANLSDRAPDRP